VFIEQELDALKTSRNIREKRLAYDIHHDRTGIKLDLFSQYAGYKEDPEKVKFALAREYKGAKPEWKKPLTHAGVSTGP
jgi:hypothetical protein